MKLTPCKKRIFDKAAELFSMKNYELVSMDDIAAALGRTKPSIYAHFKSKQDILDTIYDYFCEQYCLGRKPLEEIEPTLQNGSPLDMLEVVTHNYVKNIVNNDKMTQIIKIVYQRTFYDERAYDIAKSLMMDSAIIYIKSAFDRAVELERFVPFDTHFLAAMITNSRFCMVRNWLLTPTDETYQDILKQEKNMDDFAVVVLNTYLK